MPNVSVDFWNISLGNLITIVIMLAGGVGFVYTIRGRVDVLSNRVLRVEEGMKQLIQVLIDQGRADERMTSMQTQLNQQGKRLDETAERLMRLFNGRMKEP